jgi:FMN phosphatase YigB (HAD superfamily)
MDAAAANALSPDAFAHVRAWVFDLDNTLYPPEIRLFDQIDRRMTDYVMRTLGLARRRLMRCASSTGRTTARRWPG